MIDGHHGRTIGRATLQVRAVDGILGTHTMTPSPAGEGTARTRPLSVLLNTGSPRHRYLEVPRHIASGDVSKA